MRPAARAIKMVVVGLIVVLALVTPELAGSMPQDRRPLPGPLGYVSDHAATLEADWKARIRSVCQDLERKTGIEMVVVTVGSARPYTSAHEYASAIYQKWG